MADRTQLRVADNNDVADDDPFAELTRIMGFDPRQPAKQAQAPPSRKLPLPIARRRRAISISISRRN